jgi:hypothetical protein
MQSKILMNPRVAAAANISFRPELLRAANALQR